MKPRPEDFTHRIEPYPGHAGPSNEQIDAQIVAGRRSAADPEPTSRLAPAPVPSQAPQQEFTTAQPRFISITPGVADALRRDDDEDDEKAKDEDVSDAELAATGFDLLTPLGRARAREAASKARKQKPA